MVQNSFPVSMVGTATAGANFFRQVGATVGSALVGGLFTARLKDLLADRLAPVLAAARQQGQAPSLGSTNSLTPSVVQSLPDPVREVIIGAYNDALIPIFLWIMPLGIAAALVLLFVVEKDLATTVAASGTTAAAGAQEERREEASEEEAERRHPRTGEIPLPETGMIPIR